MRVVFCPASHSNPYTESISVELRRLGCEVGDVPKSPFIIRRRQVRECNVIHVHWVDHFMLGRGLFKTLVKSVLFLTQLALLRCAGKKIIWTAHNLTTHESKHPSVQRFFTRMLIAVSHRVLTHSPACSDRVAEHFGMRRKEKLEVVRHANYISDYPQGVSRGDARRELGIDPGAFVFLFVGAIRGYKGVLDLIDAYGRLERDGARLVIAGKPNSEEVGMEIEVAAKTHGALFHNGFVAAERMQVYMAACDVVVLPYRKILTSGTLMLAASFAKVAVVPDVPTITDTVQKSGVITFDPNRDDSLISAMRQAIEERGALQERGAESRRYVERWGWREMAASLYEVYAA